jgi:hypothetical protein
MFYGRPNPYLAPSVSSNEPLSDDAATTPTQLKLIVWLVAFFYPVFAALCFYTSWIVAWICLGHVPRPMLDDPKNIGGVMDLAYSVSVFAFFSAPILTPVCFVSCFFSPIRFIRNGLMQRLFLSFVYLALCAAVFATIRFDPGRILEWWFD